MTVTAGAPATRAATRTGRATTGRALAGASSLLAVALVLNSVLGPLVTGTIRYRMAPSLVNQLLAVDLVALAVVAPLAVLAGRLLAAGHRAGAVLATAPAAYTAYLQAQGIIGADPLGRPGNAERWFPWHLGLFVLAVGVLLAAWHASGRRPPAPWSPTRRRWTAFALIGAAVFITLGQWLPTLAGMTADPPTGASYLAGPSMAWTLALLDLGLLVPATVATAIGLIRGASWATRAGYAVTGFLALLGPAVAAMAVTMAARHDPTITTGSVGVLCVIGALLAGLGLATHRPLLTRPHQP